MAEPSVTQWNSEDHAVEGVDWEEQSYLEGCAYAREQARRRLKTLDDELLGCKPRGLRVEGFRERTLVTRFGEVVVRRRLYNDGCGNTTFALDDHLGWKPRQQARPSLTESIVSIASEVPFRMADEMVSELTAGVLSPMTVHRLLSGVGQSAMDEERDRWESCFERGEEVCEGAQQADVLYTEADGVWIHLQREKRTHYELKSAIAYLGWRSVGKDRYELVDKRVYTHSSEEMPFWEGASLEWDKQYALAGVKLFVVGGDGANWIRHGVDELGSPRRAVFQLDGFHLSRACGRGYGRKIGSAIYDAIRSGSQEYARVLMSAAEVVEGKTTIRNRLYVESNLSNGVDWRNRVPNAPPDARGLGTMESNGDKLTANRMKKRGMSWTIRGAHRMAKVIQLKRNGEMSDFCFRQRPGDQHETDLSARRHTEAIHRIQVSDWAEASLPALSGPHNSRPWTHSLRSLVKPLLRLN